MMQGYLNKKAILNEDEVVNSISENAYHRHKKEAGNIFLRKAGKEDKLLLMDDFSDNSALMQNHIVHRAVGVVYNPKFERNGNYVPMILSKRYDPFIYLDETKALHPLHIKPDGHRTPETFPFGV